MTAVVIPDSSGTALGRGPRRSLHSIGEDVSRSSAGERALCARRLRVAEERHACRPSPCRRATRRRARARDPRGVEARRAKAACRRSSRPTVATLRRVPPPPRRPIRPCGSLAAHRLGERVLAFGEQLAGARLGVPASGEPRATRAHLGPRRHAAGRPSMAARRVSLALYLRAARSAPWPTPSPGGEQPHPGASAPRTVRLARASPEMGSTSIRSTARAAAPSEK